MVKMKLFNRFVDSDCQIFGFHLHKYKKGGLVRIIPCEKLSYQGYDWTSEVVYPGINTTRRLVQFITKNKLLRIDDNIEEIRRKRASLHDYKEYEYEDTNLMPVGKAIIPMPTTEWTDNPNGEDLTGNERICHHMYFGYRIFKNSDGTYSLDKSPLVDDLLSIKDEYPYFKEKYVKQVIYDVDEKDNKQYRKRLDNI